jgi:hypothetical protein
MWVARSGVALNSRRVGELALCGPRACTVKGPIAAPARCFDVIEIMRA